jgi:hypothetical protein
MNILSSILYSLTILMLSVGMFILTRRMKHLEAKVRKLENRD